MKITEVKENGSDQAPDLSLPDLGKVLLESVDKFKTAQESEKRPERALPERREEDRDAG